MTDFAPRHAGYESRVRRSFDRQAFMSTCGARLLEVAPGRVEIVMEVSPAHGQQHGYVHGGAIGAVLDSACGYAALSLMEEASAVLTVEYKVNFLAPADAPRLLFIGRVIKAGRTLTLTEGDAFEEADSAPGRHIAAMRATMMQVAGRGIEG